MMRGSTTISLLICAIFGFALLACGNGYLDAAFSPEPAEFIPEDSETETDPQTGSDTGLDTDTDTEPVSIYVEAENFDIWDRNGNDRAWILVDEETIPEGEEDHTATAVGNAYMHVLKDTTLVDTDSTTISSNNIADPSVSCHVGYRVNVRRPGRYYIWVRGWAGDYNDNTAHVGFDNTWPDSGLKIQFPNLEVHDWAWSSHQRDEEGQIYGVPNTIYLDIETAGQHRIIFAMREDGFAFDRWVMTTETDYTPIDE